MANNRSHSVPLREHDRERTTREDESEQANARSHVSPMSHTALRIPPVRKARIPGHTGAVFRWRLDSSSKRHRSSPSGARMSRQTSQSSISPMIGDMNGPDPFIRFPESTSLLDQKLFHFLMTHASQRLYGPQQKAGFDYIRDVTMPKVLLGGEFMSWITYSAAKMRNTLSQQFREDWLLERRLHNYKLLRQMIDRRSSHDWDYIMTCLVSAGYIENSYGQVPEGLMHMKAAFVLIKQQSEGLRCLQIMRPVYALTILTTTTTMGLPTIFDTINPLGDALKEVMHNLGALQSWNSVIRYGIDNGDDWEQSRDQERRYHDTFNETLAPSERRQYWEVRRLTLNVQPLQDFLLKNDLHDGQNYEWRSRLTTLYLLNGVLHNLDRDLVTAKQFLRDLAAMITNSMHPSAPRPLHPFVPMIAICAQRLGIWFYHGPESPLPPIRTWEAILFAEVMMLGSYATRQRVMKAMTHWLYDGHEQLHDSAVLGEAELLMFSVHISESWAAKTKPD